MYAEWSLLRKMVLDSKKYDGNSKELKWWWLKRVCSKWVICLGFTCDVLGV